MGSKTKIDWCDSTWNPVTGCLHGCEYCYARRIAERFRAREIYDPECQCQRNLIERGMLKGIGKPLELNYPWEQKNKDGSITNAAYPFGFTPTFHRYKLDEPQRWKKPRTIFVCSMADLFGEWVPDEWIKQVFEAWHDYVMRGGCIHFIRGRLRFGGGKGNAPFPSAVVVFDGRFGWMKGAI